MARHSLAAAAAVASPSPRHSPPTMAGLSPAELRTKLAEISATSVMDQARFFLRYRLRASDAALGAGSS